jgi:putative FmdB family regulatory protein
MPTYVYECERCGHRFELMQGMTDPPRQRCPKCRGKVRRLLTPGGGLIFRGTGFYATDYKHKEERARRGETAGSAPEKAEPGSGEPSGTKEKDAAGGSTRKRRSKS